MQICLVVFELLPADRQADMPKLMGTLFHLLPADAYEKRR
jgi:hypothetical protein